MGDNTKLTFKEAGYEDVNWIELLRWSPALDFSDDCCEYLNFVTGNLVII
jgi:hypothetical protein